MRLRRFRRGRGVGARTGGAAVTLLYTPYTDASAVVHSVPNKFTRITNGLVYVGADYLPATAVPVTVFS